jgi:hypothetical protein
VDVQRSGQDINKQQLPAILPILPIYRWPVGPSKTA